MRGDLSRIDQDPGPRRTRAHAEPVPPEACRSTAQQILVILFGEREQRTFAVRLWDGTVEMPGTGGPPSFTLVLQRPGALRRMLLPPTELRLGEAYLRGDLDVEGDVEAAAALVGQIASRLRSPRTVARLIARLAALPADDLPPPAAGGGTPKWPLSGRLHSRSRDAEAVRFHYDAGNDFYALWLDTRMVYSCGYFPTGAEDIDTAQEAKLDYICRKLRLAPGETLLDVGCGWGGLVTHAAQHYGVRALGITLSAAQAELGRRRIAAAGLDGRCRIEVRDYRDLPSEPGFDKVASVGMFEHVGRAKLPAYFAAVYRQLRAGGLFLNHGIVTLSPVPVALRPLQRTIRPRTSFLQRHVFPDGELVTPADVLAVSEAAGFETRDLESLREHYILTLRHWVRRLEDRHDEAIRLVGERMYRVWRLYMAGSARAFATGKVGIVQALLSKAAANGESRLPLTRVDLYRPAGAPATVGAG